MRLTAVTCTAIAAAILGLPGQSLAQPTTSSPFTPGLPQSTPTLTQTSPAPVVPQTTTTSSPGGGLSSGSAVAIGIGALVVLGGISFFIWRDARRRAPIRHGTAAADAAAGSKPRPKPRKLSPAERRRRKRGRAR